MTRTTFRWLRTAGRACVLTVAAVAAAFAIHAPNLRAQDALPEAEQPAPSKARVWAGDEVAAGRYLITIAGCNDCHTDGWMMPGGENTPEEKWLMGSSLGFRGPWGTTYASNLRLFVKDYDPDTFVQVLRARNTRPPMPWSSLHSMSDQDLKAMFAYIKSLEPLGEKAPAYVPPGQEPRTPYIVFEPVMPAGMASPTPGAAPTTAPATQPAEGHEGHDHHGHEH